MNCEHRSSSVATGGGFLQRSRKRPFEGRVRRTPRGLLSASGIMSKAAPTHQYGDAQRDLCSRIQRSCFGAPKPTKAHPDGDHHLYHFFIFVRH